MFIFHMCLHTGHAQKFTKLQITAHNQVNEAKHWTK